MRRKKGRGENEWITTHSGRRFYPLAPESEEVDVKDVAWGLSHQCRWTGQCREFYPISQHSVRVMLALKRAGYGPVVQFEGLNHDDTEAYICDVSRPVKYQPSMKGYLKSEAKLEGVIFKRFGIVKSHAGIVKDADNSLLVAEANELMPRIDYPGVAQGLPQPLKVKTERPKGPMFSYYRFLYHFHRISGEISGKKGLLNNATALFRSLFR